MIETLQELLMNLVDLVMSKSIRGRAKYNNQRRMVDEVESICRRTDFGDDEAKAITMVQQAEEQMGRQGYMLRNCQSFITSNIDGKLWTPPSKE